jgi:probable Rubsico expression protein CbbX
MPALPYRIPGQHAPAPAASDAGAASTANGRPDGSANGTANAHAEGRTNTGADGAPNALTVSDVLAQSRADAVIDELERDLIGLAPVKGRIRDIAALLVIGKLRANMGLQAHAPSLHMSFTGNPGTGKTTVALRMAEILHRLGYVRKGHMVAVTRDDLVGQYIGHTAPKTKEVLKKAMGGVLFIDEAYYLYRPENERDYGQEAIEILLQVMENQRDDLVVILAGYKDRMDAFFRSNPGMSSRIAHHLDFPDYLPQDLEEIARRMLQQMQYRLSASGTAALHDYIPLRMRQPHFANARSIRNALDRARLRQANRLFAEKGRHLTRDELMTIEGEDLRASRVFS